MPFARVSAAPPALVLVLALGACAPAPSGTSAPSPSPSPPLAQARATAVPIHVVSQARGGQFVTLDETVVEHGRQRKKFEIRALDDEADRAANGNETATFTQPHIIFHSSDGKTLIADAPRATVEQRTKDVFMSGGVRAQTESGAVLTCRTLRYDGRTERIHGEGDVRLVEPGWDMGGDRLDGDIRLDNVHITKGNVR